VVHHAVRAARDVIEESSKCGSPSGQPAAFGTPGKSAGAERKLTAAARALPELLDSAAWHEEPVGTHHDREAFDCGEAALNDFCVDTREKSRSGRAKTFLAVENARTRVS